MAKRQHSLGIVDARHILEDDGGRDPLETFDEPGTAPSAGDDEKVEKNILTDRVIEAHDARLDGAAESWRRLSNRLAFEDDPLPPIGRPQKLGHRLVDV